MSKTLNISKGLQLPIDIGTETIAILGRRGSGKSNTGTVLMEELIGAGQQVVLIDPKGEGWGLKAQGTGGAGLDVIVFGEPEGDLPLREEHGETIADFVVASGRSCVLSLAGIDSDSAARRFVARFAERLYKLKKKPEHRAPVMVVIEEAHLFVPQMVHGNEADVVARLQRLVRQGRSMGLGVTLIDQRPASVNKDVLTQLELMICHQLTGPQDRSALDKWIEANAEPEQAAEFRKTLPGLQPGEAWIWSPAKLKIFERTTVRRRHTFDSGSTPILGKDAAKRPKMRAVDLNDLRTQLERVVEEKKANDPAELKKQLAALQKQLNSKPVAPTKTNNESDRAGTAARRQLEQQIKALRAGLELAMKVTAKIEAMGFDGLGIEPEEIRKAIEAAANQIVKLAEQKMATRTAAFEKLKREAKVAIDKMQELLNSDVDVSVSVKHNHPFTVAAGSTPAVVRKANSPGAAVIPSDAPDWLRPAHVRLLNALAWLEAMGRAEWDRSVVAAMANVSPKSSSFGNDLSRLSANGYVTYPTAGVVTLTQLGRHAARVPDAPPTLEDVHSAWRNCPALRPAHVRLIDALIAQYPEELSREQLAEAAGVSAGSSSFGNDVSRLSSLGLAEYPKPGFVTAGGLLYPEGLR